MNQPTLAPLAMLAAILYNAGEVKKIKIKPDDASPVQEIEASVVGIEKRGDAIICTIPLIKIQHFQKVPYSMQCQILDTNKPEESLCVIVFERQNLDTQILAANGKTAIPSSSIMTQVLQEIMGR